MTDALPRPFPGEPWFRVFQVDLGREQEVTAVHAYCDPGTLDVIENLAGASWGSSYVAGRGQDHAQVRMPAAVMLAVWRQMDTMPGTDPRYRSEVSTNLGRVYFGLIEDTEGYV
jgi:hypothetical protein